MEQMKQNKTQFKLVAFDLDGTICNTLKDIASSLNRALAKLGYPTFTDEGVSGIIGKSIVYMCKHAVPADNPDAWVDVRDGFLEDYAEHLCDTTVPYPEMTEMLHALKARGIAVETGACVTEIGDGFVRYEKKGETVDVPCDKVLMAVGRRPRVEDLGLEAAGVTYSRRGIAVDDNLQTNVPDIYAIGDVNARLMLAHVATFQGRRALNHIQGLPDRIRFDLVPGAVFTVPEAASVGLSEDAAKERGMAVKCLKSFYRANGKAVSMGETEGYCKWVTDAESGKILGCHLLGAHSSDLVHEATVLLNFGASVDDLKNIIHAHPTLSEVLESAVLS